MRDPIAGLTLSEAEERIAGAAAYTEELRAGYRCANAVFLVERVSEEKGGLFRPSVVRASGRVLYGCFEPEDEVRLLHGSADTALTLTDARADTF